MCMCVAVTGNAGHGLMNTFGDVEWLPDPGATPDQFGYAVDGIRERFELAFAGSIDAELALCLEFAREKLAETSAMIGEIHRLGKKVVVHARGAEAVKYSARAGADAAPPGRDLDFRLVRITGSWDLDRSLIVTNRVRFGTRGEEVIVPLRPSGGGPAVLVDRGWYPLELRGEVRMRLAAEPAGEALGMARYLEEGGARLVANAGWTSFHPASMAGTLPYPVVAWGLIEGDAPLDTDALMPPSPSELPQTGYVPYRNTIPHLEYALTWWGLAATLASVATVRLWVVPRRRTASSGGTAAGPPPGEP